MITLGIEKADVILDQILDFKPYEIARDLQRDEGEEHIQDIVTEATQIKASDIFEHDFTTALPYRRITTPSLNDGGRCCISWGGPQGLYLTGVSSARFSGVLDKMMYELLLGRRPEPKGCLLRAGCIVVACLEMV